MPVPTETGNREFVLRLPRAALRTAGIAFGIGLLLFVIVWWTGRDSQFYKVEPVADAKDAAKVDALPEPLAAGDSISGMEEPRESPEPPQVVDKADEPAPAPATLDPGADAPAAAPVAAAPSPQPLPSAPAAGGAVPVPIPGQNPPPTYPADSQRRGETGTTVVRIQVDANGVPGGVALVQRSGSRDLDRAAMEAVRKWRFQPAQRDGVPVPGSVDVPISFSLQR